MPNRDSEIKSTSPALTKITVHRTWGEPGGLPIIMNGINDGLGNFVKLSCHLLHIIGMYLEHMNR